MYKDPFREEVCLAGSQHTLTPHPGSRNPNQNSNQGPKNPFYSDKLRRLQSFTSWRYSNVQDSTRLANYGFYYTEQGDLVRCFYCSLGLKDFIKTDDPLLEHVRYSGDKCEFLIQLLGPTRLSQIKENIANGTPVVHENPSYEENKKSPIVNGATKDPIEVPVTTSRRTTHSTPHSASHSTSHSTSHSATKPTRKYRSPRYEPYAVRLSSFSNWPEYLVQTPQQLAEAGFYYTGVKDVVRCFACDGGLQRWDPSDDPWIEHCVNFPHCVFLKETKGEQYITLTRLKYMSATNSHAPLKTSSNQLQENNPRVPQPSSTAVNPEKGVVKVIRDLEEMGYALQYVESALQTLRKRNGSISVDSVIEEIESSRKQSCPEAKRPQSPKSIVDEHKFLLQQLYCLKCKTEEINTLFLPCQHHRLCMTCAEPVTHCPICDQPIVQKIKTYRP